MSTPGRLASTHSVRFDLRERGRLTSAPGTDTIRWYVPSTGSNGIVLRGARVFIATKTGTAGTASFDVRNQTTSVLSAAISSGANVAVPFTSAGTLSPNDVRIAPGNYVRIDWTTSAGTQNTTAGYSGVCVQLDYDLL